MQSPDIGWLLLQLIPDKHINPQVMLNLAPFRSLQVLIVSLGVRVIRTVMGVFVIRM